VKKPVLGITMGDAAGIGPELILKALSQGEIYEWCNPLVIGSADVFVSYKEKFSIPLEILTVRSCQEALFEFGRIEVIEGGSLDLSKLAVGKVDAMCGRAAVVCTQLAGKLAMDGMIDAVVSAPLNKEAMRAAGYHFEGQTQILSELAGIKRCGMVLIAGDIKVMMLTTHMSLRKACDSVTKERVLKMLELAHQTLEVFGYEQHKIGVAGLNPHGGEGGLFGDEEVNAIIPAIKEAREMGINAIGPVPADVVFVKAKNGEYDIVLAMYHDQANIAVKLFGFGSVVTVLAGLPIIRTSVGHGTAFDIAWQNRADPGNFIRAIQVASELAGKKLLSAKQES
jgi:4-hydroxythreonine-4-phosphate dehydrogenase